MGYAMGRLVCGNACGSVMLGVGGPCMCAQFVPTSPTPWQEQAQ